MLSSAAPILAHARTAAGCGRIKIARVVNGTRVEIDAELTDEVLPQDTIVVPERFF
jgi:hypothetical protein